MLTLCVPVCVDVSSITSQIMSIAQIWESTDMASRQGSGLFESCRQSRYVVLKLDHASDHASMGSGPPQRSNQPNPIERQSSDCFVREPR